MRVLIVDDEPEIRESLGEFFSDEGYLVSLAADGAEAMHCLATEERPCVVILDLLMPVLSGNQVYERMQRDPRLASIPIIVSTSDPSRAPAGQSVMKKPIDLDRLLGMVRRLCN